VPRGQCQCDVRGALPTLCPATSTTRKMTTVTLMSTTLHTTELQGSASTTSLLHNTDMSLGTTAMGSDSIWSQMSLDVTSVSAAPLWLQTSLDMTSFATTLFIGSLGTASVSTVVASTTVSTSLSLIGTSSAVDTQPSVPIIAGVICSVFAMIIVVGVTVFCMIRRRKQHKSDPEENASVGRPGNTNVYGSLPRRSRPSDSYEIGDVIVHKAETVYSTGELVGVNDFVSQ